MTFSKKWDRQEKEMDRASLKFAFKRSYSFNLPKDIAEFKRQDNKKMQKNEFFDEKIASKSKIAKLERDNAQLTKENFKLKKENLEQKLNLNSKSQMFLQNIKTKIGEPKISLSDWDFDDEF